ncbi:MAG: hypothetical protein WHT84_05530 [Breznakiellaceae bacterium]
MGLLQRIQKITSEEGVLRDPIAEQLVVRIERLGEKKKDLYTVLSLLKTYTPFLFAVVGVWDPEKEAVHILTSAGIGELSESFTKKISQHKEHLISGNSFIVLGRGHEWGLDTDLANAALWGYSLGTWEQRIIFFCIGTEQNDILYLESLGNILPRIAEKFISFVRKTFSENSAGEFSEGNKQNQQKGEDNSLLPLIDQLFPQDIPNSNGFYFFKIKELTESQAQQTREVTSSLGMMVPLTEDSWALICEGNLDGSLIHHHLERILQHPLEGPVRVTSRQEALSALS